MIFFNRDRLDFCRLRVGYPTWTALAREMNTSPQNLSRMLSNRQKGFSTAMLDRLCTCLKIQPGDVLFYLDPRDAP